MYQRHAMAYYIHCNGRRWLFVFIYREFGHAFVEFSWRTLVCTCSRYGEYPLCIFILHAHMAVTITINILYHIRPLTWGTCALHPSYIVRLIANSLYAHGSCECVSDPDTMNIHGVSSPQMRLYQTTCIPCMMYHNGLLLLAIVSLYQPNTMRMVAHLL